MPAETPGQEPGSPTPAPGAPESSPEVPNPAPGAPETPTPETPETPATPGTPKTYDEAYVKGLTTENANWRTKLRAAEAELTALKNEKLTAEERVAAELEALKTDRLPTLEAENLTLRVKVASQTLGIVDPEAAATLAKPHLDAGLSIDDALAKLLVEKPYLKAGPSTTPPVPPATTSPANPGGGSAAPTFTKSQIAAMTPSERLAKHEAIKAAMAAGRVDFKR